MIPYTIVGNNVNHVLPVAVRLFKDKCAVSQVTTRGKTTLEHNGPVLTTYLNPCERVLFSPLRDANPFFHFFESLWILDGRNDVKWISFFLKNIADYSDDGQTFHGAYGHRLRNHFMHDQIKWVIAHLLYGDQNSRRATVGLYDPVVDHAYSNDIPCNLSLVFLIRADKLNLTVYNRSNDMVWGAYGANVVQFSTILEIVASLIGVEVGTYTQVSNSFHVYEDAPSWIKLQNMDLIVHDPYKCEVAPFKIVEENCSVNKFFIDLSTFMTSSNGRVVSTDELKLPFFKYVAVPLYNAFCEYKRKNHAFALDWVSHCAATDWKKAAKEWLERRMK